MIYFEITNNPDDDFGIYVEIIKNEKHMGKAYLLNGQVMIDFYQETRQIPLRKLIELDTISGKKRG